MEGSVWDWCGVACVSGPVVWWVSASVAEDAVGAEDDAGLSGADGSGDVW